MASKIDKVRQGVYKELDDTGVDALILSKLRNMPKKGGRKVYGQTWTPLELTYRRQAIYKMMNAGYSKFECVCEIQKRWEVTDNTALEYYKDALESLAQTNEEVIEHIRDIQTQRLEKMYKECLEEGNRKEALKALEQLNKIGGIYKEKVEADITGEMTFDFGDK